MKKLSKNFLKKHMKTRHSAVKKPIIEDISATQIIFGCSKTDGAPVNVETDLQFAKKN